MILPDIEHFHNREKSGNSKFLVVLIFIIINYQFAMHNLFDLEKLICQQPAR